MDWNYRYKISATVLTNLIKDKPTFDGPNDCSELPFLQQNKKNSEGNWKVSGQRMIVPELQKLKD